MPNTLIRSILFCDIRDIFCDMAHVAKGLARLEALNLDHPPAMIGV